MNTLVATLDTKTHCTHGPEPEVTGSVVISKGHMVLNQ